MSNAFMSRFCSCAICLFSLTNWAEFFTISVSLNCFHKDKQTLRRKKINSQTFSDTCTDQLVVFNYSQFNIQCSATIFTSRTLVKILRQIFTVFAVSASGLMLNVLLVQVRISMVGNKSVALCFGFYGGQVQLHMVFLAHNQKSSRICNQLVVNFEP